MPRPTSIKGYDPKKNLASQNHHEIKSQTSHKRKTPLKKYPMVSMSSVHPIQLDLNLLSVSQYFWFSTLVFHINSIILDISKFFWDSLIDIQPLRSTASEIVCHTCFLNHPSSSKYFLEEKIWPLYCKANLILDNQKRHCRFAFWLATEVFLVIWQLMMESCTYLNTT